MNIDKIFKWTGNNIEELVEMVQDKALVAVGKKNELIFTRGDYTATIYIGGEVVLYDSDAIISYPNGR